ncbi:hypothetical protein MASR1M90_07000 [Desulfovibrionales bacterium]
MKSMSIAFLVSLFCVFFSEDKAMGLEVDWKEIDDIANYTLDNVHGHLVKGFHFADGMGEGLVLLTESGIITEMDEYENEVQSKDIYAYAYRLVEQDAHLVWRIMDFTRQCDLDGFDASFIVEGVKFTDLDSDGVAEIWVPYVLSCRGDPGPMTMKIIMYEGVQKYALRGVTNSWISLQERAGGEYSYDDAFAAGPREFLRFAQGLWSELMYRN